MNLDAARIGQLLTAVDRVYVAALDASQWKPFLGAAAALVKADNAYVGERRHAGNMCSQPQAVIIRTAAGGAVARRTEREDARADICAVAGAGAVDRLLTAGRTINEIASILGITEGSARGNTSSASSARPGPSGRPTLSVSSARP
jgi:hypothetical protein